MRSELLTLLVMMALSEIPEERSCLVRMRIKAEATP